MEPKTYSGLRVGDRIELVAMENDPDPIGRGELGTVTRVVAFRDRERGFDQVHVAWDSGRSLGLVVPPDEVRVVANEAV